MTLTKVKAVTGATVLAAIAMAVPVPAPALSAASTRHELTAVASATADDGSYTRDTLDLSGTWALEYDFTQHAGNSTSPADDDQTYYADLVRETGIASPPGNEPVYYGSWVDPSTGKPNAPGELIVSPFTSPRGIVLTMWDAGNPDIGFADAYSATFAAQGANDTSRPLSFTGVWRDVDNNGGYLVAMYRVPSN